MIRSAKPNQWLKFSKMDIHRIIATIFVVVLIIGMSTGVLIMMYQHTEADCWASLEDNAESAGRKISLMMKDNHTFLDNLGHLLAAHIDLKSNAVVQHVQESSMGTLQAPVRMYLPDGARVTETEGLVEGTINYADLVKGYFPAGYQAEDTEVFLDYQATLQLVEQNGGYYISTPHPDKLIKCRENPENPADVVQVFIVMERRDKPIGLLSYVLVLDDLPNVIIAEAYGGESVLYVVDRRDFTVLMDSTNVFKGNLADLALPQAVEGFSINNFVADMTEGRSGHIAFFNALSTGQRTYAGTTSAENTPWSMILTAQGEVVMSNLLVLRQWFVRLLLAEIVLFAIYMIWMMFATEKQIALGAEERITVAQKQHDLEMELEHEKEERLLLMSNTDQMTNLGNRRAYEEMMTEYQTKPMEADLAIYTVDLNGVKQVNDSLGHSAGDQVIRGAAQCLQQCLGSYGHLFRVGGDEFVGILYAGYGRLDKIRIDLNETVDKWNKTHPMKLHMSCGCATVAEFPDKTIQQLAAIADERMYDNKRDFYTNIGVDREGQAEAYRALTSSCLKIIKANLNEDTFRILLLNESEKDPSLGYRTLLSEWLIAFAMSGQVHNDDRAVYMKYTNINYLREYFQKGNKVISTQYRRKINNEYKQVIMEVIPAPDYRPDDENVFLYVKCVE